MPSADLDSDLPPPDAERRAPPGAPVTARGAMQHVRVVADAVERIAPGSEIHAAGEAAPVGTVVTAARAGAGWELLAVLKDDRLDAELRWGDSNGPPVRLLDLPYTLSL